MPIGRGGSIEIEHDGLPRSIDRAGKLGETAAEGRKNAKLDCKNADAGVERSTGGAGGGAQQNPANICYVASRNQSTVSRRVAALEEALGVRLFERLDGTMTATRAGEVVIDEAERIEHHILSIQERVANQDAVIAGSVRVTTVSTIANHILIPAMSQLRSRHPALVLISDNAKPQHHAPRSRHCRPLCETIQRRRDALSARRRNRVRSLHRGWDEP